MQLNEKISYLLKNRVTQEYNVYIYNPIYAKFPLYRGKIPFTYYIECPNICNVNIQLISTFMHCRTFTFFQTFIFCYTLTCITCKLWSTQSGFWTRLCPISVSNNFLYTYLCSLFYLIELSHFTWWVLHRLYSPCYQLMNIFSPKWFLLKMMF